MRTIGVVQGGGDHYPFVDPSDDIKGVVADISVGLNREVLSVAIKSLVIEDKVEICLVDENDTVLFNSKDKRYDRKEDNEWGGYYRVVYWESRDLQLKLVLYKTDKYLDIQPENGLLDLRTVFVKPPHISSITVVDREGNRHQCSDKRIVFQEGYNTSLSIEATNTSVRRQNTLSVNAIAGAGLGRTPCISDDPEYRVVRSINSVTTEDGALQFIPEDGYGFEISPRAAKIYVYNTDTPCCSCDEMEDLSDYVADVAKKYWEISEDVNDLRDKHEKNIDNWVKKAPSSSKITRDPFMLQAVGDGCQNVMVRADFTNVYSKPIFVSMTLGFNYFHRTRNVTTLPVGTTTTVHYQENGARKFKTITQWTMKTTTDDTVSDDDSLMLTTSHLEPGKTMSVQLTGLYSGYKYNHVPTFLVQGDAITTYGAVSTIRKSVDCSCSYDVDTVADITNDTTIQELYNEVWEIKQYPR